MVVAVAVSAADCSRFCSERDIVRRFVMATSTTRNSDPLDPTGSGTASPGGSLPPPPRSGASASVSASSGSIFDPPPLLTVPVVIDRRGNGGRKKRRGRRKKKYSRSTKGIQRFLFGSSRAGYRVTNSLARGLNTFVRRGNRSARRRRDGFVRDAFRNFSRGFGRAASEFGRAPFEIARRVSTRRVWRTFRIFVPVRR